MSDPLARMAHLKMTVGLQGRSAAQGKTAGIVTGTGGVRMTGSGQGVTGIEIRSVRETGGVMTGVETIGAGAWPGNAGWVVTWVDVSRRCTGHSWRLKRGCRDMCVRGPAVEVCVTCAVSVIWGQEQC